MGSRMDWAMEHQSTHSTIHVYERSYFRLAKLTTCDKAREREREKEKSTIRHQKWIQVKTLKREGQR